MGPLLFSIVIARTGSYRQALLSLIFFFVVGLIVLAITDTDKGVHEAGHLAPEEVKTISRKLPLLRLETSSSGIRASRYSRDPNRVATPARPAPTFRNYHSAPVCSSKATLSRGAVVDLRRDVQRFDDFPD